MRKCQIPDSERFEEKVTMMFFRSLMLLGVALYGIACTDQEASTGGTEDPLKAITISEVDVNNDFTSTSFKLTNQAESTWYSSIIVLAEFREAGAKIGLRATGNLSSSGIWSRQFICSRTATISC